MLKRFLVILLLINFALALPFGSYAATGRTASVCAYSKEHKSKSIIEVLLGKISSQNASSSEEDDSDKSDTKDSMTKYDEFTRGSFTFDIQTTFFKIYFYQAEHNPVQPSIEVITLPPEAVVLS